MISGYESMTSRGMIWTKGSKPNITRSGSSSRTRKRPPNWWPVVYSISSGWLNIRSIGKYLLCTTSRLEHWRNMSTIIGSRIVYHLEHLQLAIWLVMNKVSWSTLESGLKQIVSVSSWLNRASCLWMSHCTLAETWALRFTKNDCTESRG